MIKNKIQYLFLLSLSAVFLSSCTPMVNYRWDIMLQEPKPSNDLSYSDEYIDVTFAIGETQIGFDIQNKTDNGIKINWDELAFISPNGKSERVIHNGVRLIERNSPQAPTIIPPKSRISDILIPSDNIAFTGDYWHELELFYGHDKSIYVGKRFKIYFPLEIKSERKEYNFSFQIKGAVAK